jgi:hypothetical protein
MRGDAPADDMVKRFERCIDSNGTLGVELHQHLAGLHRLPALDEHLGDDAVSSGWIVLVRSLTTMRPWATASRDVLGRQEIFKWWSRRQLKVPPKAAPVLD